MNELERIFVFEEKGNIFTNSLNVTEIFGKQHKNVLQSIQNLECSEEFRRLNFQPTTYLNSQNKEILMYNITKDGFAFLGFSFTGKEAAHFKESYITKFNQMEQTIKQQAFQIENLRKTILTLGGESSLQILEQQQTESLQVIHGFPFHDPDYICQWETRNPARFIAKLVQLEYIDQKKDIYMNRHLTILKPMYLYDLTEKAIETGDVQKAVNHLCNKRKKTSELYSFRIKRELLAS